MFFGFYLIIRNMNLGLFWENNFCKLINLIWFNIGDVYSSFWTFGICILFGMVFCIESN